MTACPLALVRLAAIFALVAGCARTRYRYVDLAAARQEALAAARASGTEQGICPVRDGRAMVALVKVGIHGGKPWMPIECDKLPPDEVASGYVSRQTVERESRAGEF